MLEAHPVTFHEMVINPFPDLNPCVFVTAVAVAAEKLEPPPPPPP
jgi:hypothetical protein